MGFLRRPPSLSGQFQVKLWNALAHQPSRDWEDKNHYWPRWQFRGKITASLTHWILHRRSGLGRCNYGMASGPLWSGCVFHSFTSQTKKRFVISIYQSEPCGEGRRNSINRHLAGGVSGHLIRKQPRNGAWKEQHLLHCSIILYVTTPEFNAQYELGLHNISSINRYHDISLCNTAFVESCIIILPKL